MQNVIETKGEAVLILPMYIADAKDLYDLIDKSRDDLKNLVWAESATLESTTKWLDAQSINRHANVIMVGEKLAGCIEVRDKPEGWELGYWLGTPFRGHGYMNPAAKYMADLYVGYRKKPVIAHVRLKNVKSKAILEYAGLREVRRDDEWIYLQRDE